MFPVPRFEGRHDSMVKCLTNTKGQWFVVGVRCDHCEEAIRMEFAPLDDPEDIVQRLYELARAARYLLHADGNPHDACRLHHALI